jgi:hypothetical protein
MRAELMRKSKLYSKFPNDPIIRGSFFKFRKLYNRCCKQKYRNFRTTIMNKLDTLHDNNPNAYWKLLKDLRAEQQSQDQSMKISGEQWVNHFSTLFSVDKKFSTQNKYFEDPLAKSEKSHQTFTPLDFAIKDKEIMDAIKHLKNNKSAGLDGIRNEMLKNQCTVYFTICTKIV